MALSERTFCGPTRKITLFTNWKACRSELFHFHVVAAVPVGPGQKRPTDFDLAFFFVVYVESRRTDDLAIFGIDGDQCSPGFQDLAEKSLENLFLVT